MSEKAYDRLGKKMGYVSAVFAVTGFCNSMLYPVQSAQLNGLIPFGQRATLILVSSIFFSIGMIFLFSLAGALADRIGLIRVFGGMGLAFALVWNRKSSGNIG